MAILIDEAVFALKLINDEGLSRRTGERIRKTWARMIELSQSRACLPYSRASASTAKFFKMPTSTAALMWS